MHTIRKIAERFWWFRLGALAFHLYVFIATRFAFISCTVYWFRHKRDLVSTVHVLAGKFVAIGQKVEHRSLPPAHSSMRSYRLWLRFAEFSTLFAPFILMPAEARAALDDDEARALIHYGELAIHMYVAGGKEWIAAKAAHSKRMPPIVRTTISLAGIYQMVAAAYLQLTPNDAAHAFSVATGYLRTAAEQLEDCVHPEAAWLAGKVWGQMGEAYLTFPFDPQALTKSIKCLERAAKVLEPYLDTLKGPPIPLDGRQVRQGSSLDRKLMRQYISELLDGRRRTRLGSSADPQYAWFRLAALAQDIDRQIGVVRRRQGDMQGALRDFERALTRYDNIDAQALIQVEIGYVHLEQDASDKTQLTLAVRSFGKVIRQKAELKRTAPLVRALIGSAFAVLQLYQLADEKEKKRLENDLDSSTKNLRIAIKAAKESSLIELCQEAAYTLGLIRMNKREYGPAYRAFSLSSRVLDRLQRRSRTFRSRRFRIGAGVSLYNNLLYVAARYGRLNRKDGTPGTFTPGSIALRSCLTFSERGRSVFLDGALANRELLPQTGTVRDLTDFFALRRAWHQAEINLEMKESGASEAEEFTALIDRRDRLEQRYFQELDRIRVASGNASYDPDRTGSPVRFSRVQRVLNNLSEDVGTALIQYHVSDNRVHIVVVLPASKGRRSSTSHRELVIDLNEVSGSLYSHQGPDCGRANVWNWVHWGNGRLRQLLETLEPLANQPMEIIREWEKHSRKRIKRLILVPHKFLHMVPLHAIVTRSGTYWGDEFTIQYVPSASVLCRLATRPFSADGREGIKMISVAAESRGREFEREARLVASIVGGSVMCGAQNTFDSLVRNIQNVDYLHFSCHGVYDAEAPLDSGLDCLSPMSASGLDGASENARLTLGDIFAKVSLLNGPTVVLSACETGINKIEQSHDEFIGLPAGFLYAGARTVVSSLWPVDDIATMLLMKRMWEGVVAGNSVSQALRASQTWLRGLSADEVYGMSQPSQADLASDELDFQRLEYQGETSNFPYANPYWWAGFTVNGLA